MSIMCSIILLQLYVKERCVINWITHFTRPADGRHQGIFPFYWNNARVVALLKNEFEGRSKFVSYKLEEFREKFIWPTIFEWVEI